MSWGAKPKRNIAELASMSGEERQKLTVAEASAFITPDTIELAEWVGLLETGRTPYECLVIIKKLHLDTEDNRPI
jgi:hypothetical protein